jgi:hypothetical protein
VRKSGDHTTPTLFAMPILCSVQPTPQAFASKGAVIVRAEVSGKWGC